MRFFEMTDDYVGKVMKVELVVVMVVVMVVCTC